MVSNNYILSCSLLIQDSSDANLDLMVWRWLRKVGAHTILKTLNLQVAVRTARFLVFYIIDNHVQPSGSVQLNLYFTRFFDIIGCLHYLAYIIPKQTNKQKKQ